MFHIDAVAYTLSILCIYILCYAMFTITTHFCHTLHKMQSTHTHKNSPCTSSGWHRVRFELNAKCTRTLNDTRTFANHGGKPANDVNDNDNDNPPNNRIDPVHATVAYQLAQPSHASQSRPRLARTALREQNIRAHRETCARARVAKPNRWTRSVRVSYRIRTLLYGYSTE